MSGPSLGRRIVINHRDLEAIPPEAARALLRSPRAELREDLAHELRIRALDGVMRVVLRLTGLASTLDAPWRDELLVLGDELDGAVRAARGVVFDEAAQPVADAAPGEDSEVALLDRQGVIVWTNPAWGHFCLANGGDPDRAGVGRSYLAECDAADDPPSAEVGRAIRSALRGGLPAPARVVVPCSAPGRLRAFDVLVSSRLGDDGSVLGATVALTEI